MWLCVKRPQQVSTAKSLATCAGRAGRKARHADSVPAATPQANTKVALKCVNFGEGHATTIHACPKKVTAIKKSKTAQEVVRARTPTVPAMNAWSKKFVPTMEDFPQTLAVATAVSPLQLKHTVEVSKPQEPLMKPATNKGIIVGSASKRPPATVQTAQWRTSPKEPQQQKEVSQRCGVALRQPSQTQEPQEYELEAIMIALNGETALLKKITTGSKILIPALRNMMEAALDAINTLIV